MCGIYAIYSKVRPIVYVGQTRNKFSKRWATHVSSLKGGRHHSRGLQRHVDKYGMDALEFRVLLKLDRDSKDLLTTLVDAEESQLAAHISMGFIPVNAREIKKGSWCPDEKREAMRIKSTQGRNHRYLHTPAARAKARQTLNSPEYREQASKRARDRGSVEVLMTPEVKEKAKQAARTEAAKKRHSEALKAFYKTEAGKAALQKRVEGLVAHRGHPVLVSGNGLVDEPYPSIGAAAKDLGIHLGALHRVAVGKRTHTRGYKVKRVQGTP